jgi:hypothetical protein
MIKIYSSQARLPALYFVTHNKMIKKNSALTVSHKNLCYFSRLVPLGRNQILSPHLSILIKSSFKKEKSADDSW